MPKRSRPFQEVLQKNVTDRSRSIHYLNAAIADSPSAFLMALRDVAEAQQMSQVAIDAGVARESLYRMLSSSGNPTLSNLVAIMKALGLAIRVDVANAEYDELEADNSLSDANLPLTVP